MHIRDHHAGGIQSLTALADGQFLRPTRTFMVLQNDFETSILCVLACTSERHRSV